MIVAVHTESLLKDGQEGAGYFTRMVVGLLAKQYAQHRFYLLSAQPIHSNTGFPGNVEFLTVPSPVHSPLPWKYWNDVKLSLTLRKLRVNVLVSLDGSCSLRTKVPQCLLVPDLKFLSQPEAYKKKRYLFYKRYTSRFLKKAETVIALSQAVKNDILQKYQTDPQKIAVLYPAAREEVHPMPFEQQTAVKEKYTQGKEFFMGVNAAGVTDLIRLLKAFSVFKKRQQSEMKLVLAGGAFGELQEFLQLFDTYKYRQDVVLTGTLKEEELMPLVASAYALVHFSSWEDWGMLLLDSMKCNVPVLSPGHAQEREMGRDAALYFNMDDPADIADKLMLVYKDEDLRKSLIKKGKAIQTTYNWQHTANVLWEAILKAVGEAAH